MNLNKIKNRYFDRNYSWKKIGFFYLVLICMSVITVYPFLNILKSALSEGSMIYSMELSVLPQEPTLDNFKRAFTDTDLLIWLKNSLIVSVLTAIFGVVVSVSAAYAFSRFRFWGKKVGLMTFLITQMFPAPMLLLPMFILISKLNLIDSFFGLLVPYTALAVPFCVWMLKGYFDTIPKSLEESAYIDGASVLKTLVVIILPLSAPALAITALFSFMTAWSEFIVANIILVNPDSITLPIGLISLAGDFSPDWGVYSAAAFITAFPAMIMFMIVSKYLVGGLTLGGVKG